MRWAHQVIGAPQPIQLSEFRKVTSKCISSHVFFEPQHSTCATTAPNLDQTLSLQSGNSTAANIAVGKTKALRQASPQLGPATGSIFPEDIACENEAENKAAGWWELHVHGRRHPGKFGRPDWRRNPELPRINSLHGYFVGRHAVAINELV